MSLSPIKKTVVSAKVLAHFDPQQESVVTCDASSYGLGAYWLREERTERTSSSNIVWWPGLDGDIEHKVQGCSSCQETRNAPPKLHRIAGLGPISRG